MYSRVLRNVLNVSVKLKDKRTLKNVNLSFPILPPLIQKVLSCTSHHCCVRHCSSRQIKVPKNPLERKHLIDAEAQKQIDDLIAEKPEIERFMKILELEVCVMREDGERVPSQLRPRDWAELVQLKSSSSRKKFLDYLFTIEKQNEKTKQLKMEKMLELEEIREQRKNESGSTEMQYGFGYNFMLRRIVESTMNQLWIWNSLKAIMFGNKLVFDCSYDRLMSPLELKSCAKQLMESYALNRQHNFPYEIFLCNANVSGPLISRLIRFVPTLFDDDFPITVTSKSYTEIFEPSKLVYLTANAPTVLEKHDPDSIYIIGAYVDKGSKKPVSLGKAKQENLRMAKLPIDKYVHFGDGSGKNLTLNQVCGIMLDAQTDEWQKAFDTYLPRRKLYESRVYALEKKIEREIRLHKRNTQQTLNEEENLKPTFYESAAINDFSHAARAKYRNNWNKG